MVLLIIAALCMGGGGDCRVRLDINCQEIVSKNHDTDPLFLFLMAFRAIQLS